MTGLVIVAVALLGAMVSSELALRGTKLQTGLGRVVIAWGSVFLAAAFPLLHYGSTSLVAFAIFWGGSFLSWFGVRSHIESSILLRMLYLLRGQPMTDAQLLGAYAAHYGPAMRLEELLRGGLTVKNGERLSVTPKGKTILRIVSMLRS